jgi:hypothetical protein
LRERLVDATAVERSPPNDQRNAEDCIVQAVLVVHKPVVADVLAVVARHD